MHNKQSLKVNKSDPTHYQIILLFDAFFQLANCQDLMLELEEKMKDPTDDSRVRFLEGKDPTPGELQTKLEEVGI